MCGLQVALGSVEEEVCIPAAGGLGDAHLDVAVRRGYGHPAIHNASRGPGSGGAGALLSCLSLQWTWQAPILLMQHTCTPMEVETAFS